MYDDEVLTAWRKAEKKLLFWKAAKKRKKKKKERSYNVFPAITLFIHRIKVIQQP